MRYSKGGIRVSDVRRMTKWERDEWGLALEELIKDEQKPRPKGGNE